MNLMKRITMKMFRLAIPLKKLEMKSIGIQFFPPNYLFLDNFNEKSVVIDVGCSYEAEFSMHMIQKYNLTAFGVDPTRKHAGALKQLEENKAGKFKHLAIAVTAKNGTITFNESKHNESGSILPEHSNIQNDETITYDVETVSMKGLVQRIGTTCIDYLKLDLEGAEYELLENITKEDISPFKQIFIEFHHHCTNHTIRETNKLVQLICSIGYKKFTLDHHNYLFYRE